MRMAEGPMASITLIDESTRPKAPAIAGATAGHRRQGSRLAAIHRLHLQQFGQVQRLVEQIAAGAAGASTLGAAVAGMDMARNYRLFGAVCGEECQMLTFHHTAEDREIFPQLKASGVPGLVAVVERLEAEHLVVHALIDELQQGAEAIAAEPGPAAFARLRDTLGRMDKVLRSHFAYEETELEEALGFYNVI